MSPGESSEFSNTQAILSAELPFLKEVLEAKHVLPTNEIDESIVELKKYFLLMQRTDEPLAMISGTIDEVWHYFLLFTKQYRGFCQRCLGEYVDHQPNTKSTPVPNEAMRNFVRAYSRYFGQLPTIWTRDLPSGVADYVFGRSEVLPEGFRWSGWPGRRESDDIGTVD